MTPKSLIFSAVFVVALALDQLTKQLVVRSFYYGERMPVIEGFLDITHVRNPGGAFSFFATGDAEWRLPFFIGTTLLALVLLIVFHLRLPANARLAAVALGAILGGAVGNLIDRIVYGEVIDWIDVHLWWGYTWPTFNVADSCIVVGVALLLYETYVVGESADSTSAAPASGG